MCGFCKNIPAQKHPLPQIIRRCPDKLNPSAEAGGFRFLEPARSAGSCRWNGMNLKNLKEDFTMACQSCKANPSIKCTVQQCSYHCSDKDYCSLDSITVGTHEANPTMNECTDCKSFQLKA